ncbi:DUF1853 family protein [bacterium SCSIO 12696]|nr:DUF1853 family protein [bacterium SCSIO 12696]
MQVDWNSYQSPHVRKLAWALYSPPLLLGFTGNLPATTQSDTQLFADLDRKPDRLDNYLSNVNSHRLGYYFEALWAFYFEHHPEYQLLGHNLQVINTEKRTLGAFDFIYRHLPSSQVHHLEVAVKFYLFTGNHNQLNDRARWPGPNPKDNLATKEQRLLDHQLPLSRSTEGRIAIAKLGADRVTASSAALKGYLFYPWNSGSERPDWTPENHCFGHWLYASRLPQLVEQHPDSDWHLLEKQQWLGTRFHIPQAETHTGEELLELAQISDITYPVMAARVSQVGEGFNEKERFFVVPDTWPKHD